MTLIRTEKLFKVSGELLAELRNARIIRGSLEREHNAFLIHPGLGPVAFLSADGYILWDPIDWEVEPNRRHAFCAIVVGAQMTGITRLLELLPSRPSDGVGCTNCQGSGWQSQGFNDKNGEEFRIVCWNCGGLGWLSEGLDLDLYSRWDSDE